MDRYGLVVIGSGPAGVAAAAGYVDAGGEGPVLLVTSDQDEPYERPPLSKDVLAGQSAAERSPIGEAPLPDVVELRLGTTVTGLDLEARTVALGGESIAYESLVIAVGASPVRLESVEAEAEVFCLRSLDDARRLTAAAGHARSAVVIGSGFIGCEAAASLGSRGIHTTLVTPEAGLQQARLGEHAATHIASWLTELGVTVRTGVSVTGVDAPCTVHLSDGVTLAPDLILTAVGISAAAEQFAASGLQVHQGRIVVDEYLAAAPGVWAAGDCARALNITAGRPLNVEHWGDALTMGELAGRNAAGAEQAAWTNVPGFWSEIGQHTLQYAAWGDGYETADVVERPGGFTVWYSDADKNLVGVLTYNADDDYKRGSALLSAGAPVADALHPPGTEPKA